MNLRTYRQLPRICREAVLCVLALVLSVNTSLANARPIATTPFIEVTPMAGKPQFHPLVAKLCQEHPDAGNRTLAKVLMQKAPLEFKTLENARKVVRGYRGQDGAKSKRAATKRGTYRAGRKPGEMPKLPESVYKEPVPFELDASRILVLSDLHLPHHDPVAIEAALKYGDSFKPNAILVNGDLLDCYAASRFDKDPTVPKLAAELAAGKEFWAHVRKRYPRAKLIYKLGNHDERLTNYIWQNAPLLAEIPEIMSGWEVACGIPQNKVTVVGDQRDIFAGKLLILHGHEKGRGVSSPVNPARGAFMRLLTSVLEGHSHRQSEHDERTALGDVIACRSTGCLCGTRPPYAKHNRWTQGAATVTVEKNGDYRVSLFRIINGKVF